MNNSNCTQFEAMLRAHFELPIAIEPALTREGDDGDSETFRTDTIQDIVARARSAYDQVCTKHGHASRQAADALLVLGWHHRQAIQTEEAFQCFSNARDLYIGIAGPESVEVARSLWGCAEAIMYHGFPEFERAELYFEEAVSRLSRTLGGAHAETRGCLLDLVELHRGFRRDEKEARSIEWYLEATAPDEGALAA